MDERIPVTGQRPAIAQDWLARTGQAVVPPVTVRGIGAGHSNVTLLVEDSDGHAWVLRHPPAGRRDKTAHDVHREARILRALATSEVPVPTVIATGRDEAGIPGPFYLMECAPGVALAAEGDAEALTTQERRILSQDVLDVLATLHAIRPDEVGLADLGRPDGYIERQLARTARNWSAWGAESPATKAWQACRRRLERRIPPQQRTVIAHGDYRLSNLLIEHGRVTAVLDWELCTLGDPLADLAWLADDWRAPDEPAIAIPSPTRVGGFHDRDRMIADYAAATGLDVSDLDYYRAFTHWKAATLLQGVLLRRRSGVRNDHGAPLESDIELTVQNLLDEAVELS